MQDEIEKFIHDAVWEDGGCTSAKLQERGIEILAKLQSAQQSFAADVAVCTCELSNLQGGSCTKCGLPWFPPRR